MCWRRRWEDWLVPTCLIVNQNTLAPAGRPAAARCTISRAASALGWPHPNTGKPATFQYKIQ